MDWRQPVTDVFTSEERSRLMARVRGKDTRPELVVRSVAHRLGYRFRLHRRELPGTPDLVLTRHRAAVFVNGCFWHGHDCKRGALPRTNEEFWSKKIKGNAARDAVVHDQLVAAGWRVLTIWECETHDTDSIAEKLREFLNEKEGAAG